MAYARFGHDSALDELERDVEENIPNDADGSAT
jgi:hypothetical protein